MTAPSSPPSWRACSGRRRRRLVRDVAAAVARDEAQANAVAAQSNLQAAGPAAQASFAEHGTYEGSRRPRTTPAPRASRSWRRRHPRTACRPRPARRSSACTARPAVSCRALLTRPPLRGRDTVARVSRIWAWAGCGSPCWGWRSRSSSLPSGHASPSASQSGLSMREGAVGGARTCASCARRSSMTATSSRRAWSVTLRGCPRSRNATATPSSRRQRTTKAAFNVAVFGRIPPRFSSFFVSWKSATRSRRRCRPGASRELTTSTVPVRAS
jgi:hypothetical protein